MGTILLLIIYLAFISLGLPDSLLGASWPVMRPDLEAPIGMAGLLSMTVTVGTIVSSLVSGAVVSRFGTGSVTLASCIMTAGALLGFSYAPSIVWLIVCAIPLGLGGGAVDAGLNHYVAARYKAHHMSWLHCFWGIGATAGPNDYGRVLVWEFFMERRVSRRSRNSVCVSYFAFHNAPVMGASSRETRRRTSGGGAVA
ncbi:MFS transporter [Paenibacillus prosopidis]|uniref:MFS transporter n=1 Tax=Paenibacillus prosopidis TaxID=630520 RepID=A0A368W0R8_9BACL|nr:MFS transporter [Paenibacillus prosopidis]